MGAVKKLRPKAVQDLWQRQATAAAIQSARKMINDGVVSRNTPVGHLSDEQLGWLLCAGTCSWIATRAAQAVNEGNAAVEMNIRNTGTAPPPWDAGAVETILPELGAMEGIDWGVRVFDWPKDTMLLFLSRAYALMCGAIAARDRGGDLTAPQAPMNDALPAANLRRAGRAAACRQ
jgi:hypothetical protein